MHNRSLIWSFNYAIEGIVYTLKTQRNMRVHVAVALAVVAASLFFRIGRIEFIAVAFAVTFMLVAELMNTAIEAAVDVATQGFDPLAKIAKDVAAGAVFIAAINALVVGYIVFFARLSNVTDLLIHRVRQTPAHITVVALVLTALIVLVTKAVTKTGTFMRGGWPCGHTALATAGASAIAYLTGSAGAAVVAAFLAFLVAQSRVENGAHGVWQVLAGGVLGIIITTLVFQLFWL
jgi:diacylglycerol kinase (ATP)